MDSETLIAVARELQHRLDNFMSVVIFITRNTLSTSADLEEGSEKLLSRLYALSRSYKMVAKENWEGKDMDEMVSLLLMPYSNDQGNFILENPPAIHRPDTVRCLYLIFHELITNSLKYGSLTRREGRVHVTWEESFNDNGSRLITFNWEEKGGPAPLRNIIPGYGMKFIKCLSLVMQAEIDCIFPETGLRLRICFPDS